MKLLFDQGTPAPLRGRLPAHLADTLADWREVRLRTTEIGEAIAASGAGEVIEVPIRVK